MFEREDNYIRQELHDLLDRMLDEGTEVGNLSHMTTLDYDYGYGAKIINIRLVIQRTEYDLPYPAPDKFLTPPGK